MVGKIDRHSVILDLFRTMHNLDENEFVSERADFR